MNSKTKAALVLAAALLGGGCQDLIVENTNSPDRQRALAQPDAVELLAASTYPNIYNRTYRGTAGYVVLPMTADEATNSSNTSGGRDLSTVPRRAYDNNPVNSTQYALVNLFWGDFYEGFSNATDALKVINEGLVIETGNPVQDNTHRLRVFAKLAQGLALGPIGLLFDQAYAFDENTPDAVIENPQANGLDLVPYNQVVAKAISLLDEAIVLAESGLDFTIPLDWLYAPADLTRDDVINIANAYAARYMVMMPRTPEERADVDWQEVLNRVSLVTNDVRVQLGANSTGQNNPYVNRAHSTTSGARWYASMHVVGPADVSGEYQNWLNAPVDQRTRFLVTTPDRRITGDGGPTTNGTYFRYDATNRIDPLYGTYRESYYQWMRHYAANGNAATTGTFAVLPLDELKLYAAEAYLRLGQLDEAAAIINQYRANGQLPDVTAAGVVDAADCVPRTDDGECGSLMDALIHERMIELAFVDPMRGWADRRGFGTLTTGTILHLPVPYAQQRILDIPYYTFGGTGPGSAQ
jgi:hypothetical protein